MDTNRTDMEAIFAHEPALLKARMEEQDALHRRQAEVNEQRATSLTLQQREIEQQQVELKDCEEAFRQMSRMEMKLEEQDVVIRRQADTNRHQKARLKSLQKEQGQQRSRLVVQQGEIEAQAVLLGQLRKLSLSSRIAIARAACLAAYVHIIQGPIIEAVTHSPMIWSTTLTIWLPTTTLAMSKMSTVLLGLMLLPLEPRLLSHAVRGPSIDHHANPDLILVEAYPGTTATFQPRPFLRCRSRGKSG